MQFKDYLIFLLPIATALVTQALKFGIYSFKHGWKIEYFFTHGHMPSSHTAFVTSLITAVGYYEGINSGAFAVAVVLAIIVIDDAVRLRMYMGDQGRYLNMLIRQLPIDESKFPRLKERIGHRVSEVIVGGIFGVIFTFLFAYYL